MNAVRSMLIEQQVPKAFWPEAVRWCVHIQNRCPTAAVKNKTPEEARSGVKPTVEYFRVFGYIAHVHIPDQKRSKLDDKSKKCVFLGVSDESKAYRLFDPVSRKIIVSKDVVFEEEESLDWGRTEEECKLEWGDDEDKSDGEMEQNEEDFDGADSNNSIGSGDSGGLNSSSANSPPN